MDKQDIYELIDRFERSGLGALKLRDGGFSLELRKPYAQSTVPAAAPAAPTETVAPPLPAEETGEVVRAPLVGTYYAAPAPGEAPYVRVGERVEKGKTLCLIEAMKTMSEIQAPCDLIVEALLVQDGSLVSYDAPLVRYRHVS